MNTIRSSFLVLSLLAACGGGGGGMSQPAPGAGADTLHVVIDTGGGVDALIQTQVVGATLQRADGSQTGNLLSAPRIVTLNDPSGEAESLELQPAPAGSYVALHLAVAPGSCSAYLDDDSMVDVDLPSADLAVPFEDGFQPNSTRTNWLAVRHSGTSQLLGSGRRSWIPAFIGESAAGAAVSAVPVTVLAVNRNGFAATLPGDDHGVVHVEFEQGTELFDDHGGRHDDSASWLANVGVDQRVCVQGAIDDDGRVTARRAGSSSRNPSPRLIGRITAIDAAATTFTLHAFAEARAGGRHWLSLPIDFTVDASAAEFRFSHTFRTLTFADLRVGDLAKVAFSARTDPAVTATEVEVVSRRGLPAGPQIEGMVDSVDPTARTITVVARGDDPLVLGGQTVTSVVVSVLDSTMLFRKERGVSSPIRLAAVQPHDRIWVRGTVTGSNTVDADWIRVRQDG
jgi:hypothetical protein